MPPYYEIASFTHLERKIESMLKGHQVIVDLLKSPNLAEIVKDLSKPAVRKAAAADPLKAARDAGLNLPAEGVSIQMLEFPNNWEVEIQVLQGASLLIMGLNSRKGFYTR